MEMAGPSRTQLTSTSLEGMLLASVSRRRSSRAHWCRHGTAAESVLPPPRGSFDCFFRIVPVKGPLAVNRHIPGAVGTLTQSSRFHSVVGIGHPLMVRVRGRSCHVCDRYWSGMAAFAPLKGFKQEAERLVCH
eukprot:6199044-Pleurochrysis_carterae.AAC.1